MIIVASIVPPIRLTWNILGHGAVQVLFILAPEQVVRLSLRSTLLATLVSPAVRQECGSNTHGSPPLQAGARCGAMKTRRAATTTLRLRSARSRRRQEADEPQRGE